jgi:hypothetical protein
MVRYTQMLTEDEPEVSPDSNERQTQNVLGDAHSLSGIRLQNRCGK